MINIAYISKEHQVRSKKPVKKKPQRKPNSDGKTPIPTGEKICQCGCGKTKHLSIHHVFYGRGKRKLSNRFKCTDYLCYQSHQSSYGIHGQKHPNFYLDYQLKVKHQRRLINEGMTLKEFIFYFDMDYDGMGYELYVKYRTKSLEVV